MGLVVACAGSSEKALPDRDVAAAELPLGARKRRVEKTKGDRPGAGKPGRVVNR